MLLPCSWPGLAAPVIRLLNSPVIVSLENDDSSSPPSLDICEMFLWWFVRIGPSLVKLARATENHSKARYLNFQSSNTLSWFGFKDFYSSIIQANHQKEARSHCHRPIIDDHIHKNQIRVYQPYCAGVQWRARLCLPISLSSLLSASGVSQHSETLMRFPSFSFSAGPLLLPTT